MTSVTKRFTITTSPGVMRRIERFFAMLHWNSRHGHSGIFGMPLDGDGEDMVTVSPEPDHRKDVDKIAGVGYDVELASNRRMTGLFQDRQRTNRWYAEFGELKKRGDEP